MASSAYRIALAVCFEMRVDLFGQYGERIFCAVKEPGVVEPSRLRIGCNIGSASCDREDWPILGVRSLEMLRGSSLGVLLSVCVLPDELEGRD